MEFPYFNNKTISFLGFKIKDKFNQPRYGKVYNSKYSQMIGCHNEYIVMDFIADVTYE